MRWNTARGGRITRYALTALLGSAALSLTAPAHAAPAPLADGHRVTVGIQTATASGADNRGHFVYSAPPTGVIRDYVAVANHSLKKVKVRLLSRDATSTSEAPFVPQESADDPVDVGSWIALGKTTLTLKPRTQTLVPFVLGVPESATPGDHVGAIMVSLLAHEPAKPGVYVEHRVGVRVYLRVDGQLEPRLAVTDLSGDWDGAGSVTGRGNTTVSYTLTNTGNVRLGADQLVELSRPLGLTGLSAEPTSIPEILPGGSLVVRATFPSAAGAGPMDASVTVTPMAVTQDSVGGLVATTSSVTISAWPGLLLGEILAVLLLLLIGGFLSARFRRTRRRRRDLEPPRESARVPALLRTGLAVGAGLFVAVGLGPVAAAEADDPQVWKATVEPKEGIANSPLTIRTSGGCPPPATNVIGNVFGQGFPEEGGVAIGNTEAGVRGDGPFEEPIGESLINLLASQGHGGQLSGVYRLVLSCIEAGSPIDASFGDYVVRVKFDTPDHWRALPPVSQEPGPNALVPVTGQPSEGGGLSPTAAPGGTGGTGSPTGGADPGSTGASGPPAPESERAQDPAARAAELNGASDSAAASSTPGRGPDPVLLYVGLAVLLAVVVHLAWPRVRSLWSKS